jgi:hypothetical protein
LVSTGFVVATILVSLPYISVFAGINRTTTDFMLMRQAVHIIVFFSTTLIVYKKDLHHYFKLPVQSFPYQRARRLFALYGKIK